MDEDFGAAGYVHYLDYSDGFTGIDIYVKTYKIYSLKVFNLFSINYTSIKLLQINKSGD